MKNPAEIYELVVFLSGVEVVINLFVEHHIRHIPTGIISYGEDGIVIIRIQIIVRRAGEDTMKLYIIYTIII